MYRIIRNPVLMTADVITCNVFSAGVMKRLVRAKRSSRRPSDTNIIEVSSTRNGFS